MTKSLSIPNYTTVGGAAQDFAITSQRVARGGAGGGGGLGLPNNYGEKKILKDEFSICMG